MNDPDKAAIPTPDVESDTGDAPLGAQETPRLDTCVDIRVISFRKRPHDPDGVSVKAVLDGLTRCGILPDDSTKWVKSVTFESVITKDEEQTVIEITEAR